MHAIDGQKLNADHFGQRVNGIWVPKAYTGTYGANGFYLDFSDPADIGADRSGNGNNFTPNGFELVDQTSSNYDHFTDTPADNFNYFNSLLAANPYNYVIDGGLIFGPGVGAANAWINNTFPEKLTGKKYVQFFTSLFGGSPVDRMIGITALNRTTSGGYVAEAGDLGYGYYGFTGELWRNGAALQAYGGTWGDNAYVSIAFDADNLTLEFFLNGTSQGVVNVDPGDYYFSSGVYNVGLYANNGAREWWTAGALPPAGYEGISTANLPDAPIPDSITGTFTGNNSSDGPFVYTGCVPGRIQYGTVDVLYQDRFAQSNVDFLSNGFKVRSTVSNSGTVNYTVTTTHTGGEYNGRKIPFSAPATAISN